ncbi:hypothetical protein ACPYO6_14000 [Georgenia sp. Z1344]|uniref:hypothetical protein n=1 Tax=Georgenia sp. Z1344 TaxID=3416706 RepID=UPI003CF0F709
MRRHEGSIRFLAAVVVAFVVNLVLDVTLDPPRLVRWIVVLAVVLILTAVFEVLRRRRAAARRSEEPASDRA